MTRIDYHIIKKITEGKYSLSELKQVNDWFENQDLRDELESVIHQHWEEFTPGEADEKKQMDAIYDRLKVQIRKNQPGSVSFPKRILTLYTRIAAVLLLPLAVYTAYVISARHQPDLSGWAEIYAPPGSRTKFQLPDGSTGCMNSNTTLRYPLNFKQNRHLQLSGEAYFEVVKNPKLPLVVSTKNLDVKVLGTTFSVSALEDENTTDIILQEGSVEVDNPGIGLMALMKPDQKLVFDNNKHAYEMTSLNATQYNSWKDGMLIFRNEPLADVFKRLSRWYNVKITVSDEQLKRYKYRATFKNEPIEEVIRLIAMTVPIEFEIRKRAWDAQGVYAVKEIVISKK